VIRIRAEAGYIIMPHTHPVDENIVVVKGSGAVATGDRFKKKALETREIGDYSFAAEGMAHFALSSLGLGCMEVTGEGGGRGAVHSLRADAIPRSAQNGKALLGAGQ
jgi:hypothetical protein